MCENALADKMISKSSIFLPIYIFINRSIFLSIYQSSVCLPIYSYSPTIYIHKHTEYRSTHLSTYLLFHLSIYILLSINLPISLLLYMSVCLQGYNGRFSIVSYEKVSKPSLRVIKTIIILEEMLYWHKSKRHMTMQHRVIGRRNP